MCRKIGNASQGYLFWARVWVEHLRNFDFYIFPARLFLTFVPVDLWRWIGEGMYSRPHYLRSSRPVINSRWQLCQRRRRRRWKGGGGGVEVRSTSWLVLSAVGTLAGKGLVAPCTETSYPESLRLPWCEKKSKGKSIIITMRWVKSVCVYQVLDTKLPCHSRM